MASRKQRSRRPVRTQPASGGPRRLGADKAPPPRSASAQRRYDRSHRRRNPSWLGWAAVGAVLIVVVVLVVVKVTSSSSPASGASSGRDPVLASPAVVASLSTIPASVFNSIGIKGEAAPFVVTKDQPLLRSGSLPRFVYEGAEYCPYCALMRWSLVVALSRFGTFSKLKQTSSNADYAPIPTLSFVGSTYTSKYIVFSPYETEDRDGNALQVPPADVAKLYTKYDGNGETPSAPFNPATSAGIPFLDIGNKYVSSGDPNFLDTPISGVAGGGPGAVAIAAAIADPTSTVGTAIDANVWIVEANYISAAICGVDGGAPASICKSFGVAEASALLKHEKPVS